VVGAEERAEQLLQQVVVLVGGLGAGVGCQGVGAIPPVDIYQAVGDGIQGFIPGDRAPLVKIEGLGTASGDWGVLRMSGVVTRLGL